MIPDFQGLKWSNRVISLLFLPSWACEILWIHSKLHRLVYYATLNVMKFDCFFLNFVNIGNLWLQQSRLLSFRNLIFRFLPAFLSFTGKNLLHFTSHTLESTCDYLIFLWRDLVLVSKENWTHTCLWHFPNSRGGYGVGSIKNLEARMVGLL